MKGNFQCMMTRYFTAATPRNIENQSPDKITANRKIIQVRLCRIEQISCLICVCARFDKPRSEKNSFQRQIDSLVEASNCPTASPILNWRLHGISDYKSARISARADRARNAVEFVGTKRRKQIQFSPSKKTNKWEQTSKMEFLEKRVCWWSRSTTCLRPSLITVTGL